MKIVFLHVPKTAGTTLHRLLENCYPVGKSIFLGESHPDNLQSLDDFDFISGHLRHSITQNPSLKSHQPVIFFRDPVERAISQFYFMRLDRVRDHYLKPTVPLGPGVQINTLEAIDKIRKFSLEEFLDRDWDLAKEFLGNLHTWALSDGGQRVGDLTEADLNLAKSRVGGFFLGLCERMEESVEILFRKSGWPPVKISEKHNVNPERVEKKGHKESVINKIRELCRFDIDLYLKAKNQFEAQRENREWPTSFCLPDSAFYTVDQPILGEGWHRREKAGKTWFIWSGPNLQSWLELGTNLTGKATLRITVRKLMDPSIWTDFTVRVNGVVIEMAKSWTSKNYRLSGNLPETLMVARGGRIRLDFEISSTRKPGGMFRLFADERRLGFALEKIEVLASE